MQRNPIKDLRSDNNNAQEFVGLSSGIKSEVRSILLLSFWLFWNNGDEIFMHCM